MEGFLLFAAIAVALLLLIRLLRARETQNFLNTDLSALKTTQDKWGKVAVDSMIAKVEVQSAADETEKGSGDSAYRLKDIVFSEAHRKMLKILEQELDSRFRVFVHLPLVDFVQASDPQARLDRTVSFVICDKFYLRVVAGVEFSAPGHRQSETDLLQNLFDEIKKPLILFPVRSDYSAPIVRRKLKLIQN